MLRFFLLGFFLLIVVSCASHPPVEVNDLRTVLSRDVWPGFSPLKANIAVYSDDEILEIASYCEISGATCAPFPESVEGLGDQAFYMAHDVARDYSIFPDIGLLETARLIAHEQFHAYQAANNAVFPDIEDVPLEVDQLKVEWVAALLARREYLAEQLTLTAEGSCEDAESALPQSLIEWIAAIEKYEGLAQYVDLRYGMEATNSDEIVVRRILARELLSDKVQMQYDVYSYLWSSAYATGAAKAFLHGPENVLAADVDTTKITCKPSSRHLAFAESLVRNSLNERGQAERHLRALGYLKVINVSDMQITTTANKRMFYPWGVMLVGDVSLTSGSNISSPIKKWTVAASIHCDEGKSLFLIPTTSPNSAVTITPNEDIASKFCH